MTLTTKDLGGFRDVRADASQFRARAATSIVARRKFEPLVIENKEVALVRKWTRKGPESGRVSVIEWVEKSQDTKLLPPNVIQTH